MTDLLKSVDHLFFPILTFCASKEQMMVVSVEEVLGLF